MLVRGLDLSPVAEATNLKTAGNVLSPRMSVRLERQTQNLCGVSVLSGLGARTCMWLELREVFPPNESSLV